MEWLAFPIKWRNNCNKFEVNNEEILKSNGNHGGIIEKEM